MSRRAVTLLVVGAVVAALAIAAGSALVLVRLGSAAPAVPSGDALVNFDGVAAAASAGRTVTATLGSDTAQQFSGVTGCGSRHFVAYYGGDPRAPIVITYSSSQATVAYSSEVYRFDEGPKIQGGILTWRGDFGPTGTFGMITLQVNCPAP